MSARSLARSRLVQNQPADRLRSQPAASSACDALGRTRAEQREVVLGQRELLGGGRQVRAQDVRVVGVEHRRLDRGAEQRLGVVHQEGVERIVARDEDADRVAARAAGAAELLLQCGPGAGEADADDRVEPGDVDAELERVGAGQAQQVTVAQTLLELAALLGQVAAAIGRDPRHQLGVDLGEPALCGRRHRLGATAGAYERQGADLADHQIGEQLAGLGVGRPAYDSSVASPLTGSRPGRSGGSHSAIVWAACGDASSVTGTTSSPVSRPANTSGSATVADDSTNDGLGAVVGADASQPSQDVRDVCAEDAAVVVALVDHDVADAAEHPSPPSVRRKDRVVQGVGVGQQVVGVVARPGALLAGVVAVDRGRPGELRGAGEAAQLVGRERLGRREVEDASAAGCPRSALPLRPSASPVSAGAWKASDLPDAVPVAITT